KIAIVLAAIDDPKFYDSINKIQNSDQRDILEAMLYNELSPKRKYFENKADSDELAQIIQFLGQLLIDHGKPFNSLRKPAKDLVSAVKAATQTAKEALITEKAQREKQAKRLKDKALPKTAVPGVGWGSQGKRHVGHDFSTALVPTDPHRSCCPKCNHHVVNFEIDEDTYNSQVTLKTNEFRTNKLAWDALAPAKRPGGGPPRHREQPRYLLCLCFRAHSNGAPDGGTCPSCTARAEQGQRVDSLSCGICQCSCYADWRVTDIAKIALETIMQRERDGLPQAAAVSAYMAGAQPASAVVVSEAYATIVLESDEYQREAFEYFKENQKHMHEYGSEHDHSRSILLRFMSKQDLDLPKRRALQKTLGSPTTKIGPHGVDVRSIRSPAMSGSAYNSRLHMDQSAHPDALRAEVAVGAVPAVVSVAVTAVTAPWERSDHLMLPSEGGGSMSNLFSSSRGSPATSIMPSGAESGGWESAQEETNLQDFTTRIVTRGKRLLNDPAVAEPEKKKLRQVRRQMTVQTEDTRKELKSLQEDGSEEALAYFVANLE
ncbi:hypothetical protein B484DRAFT_470713, partial [Ochromonadaceae sp. CCMP2298]